MWEPLWWHWLVLGVILMLAELGIGSFFIFWFGLSAVIVSLVLLALPESSLALQLSLWILASAGLIVAWFRVFTTDNYATRVGASAEVIGEVGLLLRDVAPFQRGEVRFQKPILGAETWPCLAEENITAGSRVVVTQVEGSLLKVAPQHH